MIEPEAYLIEARYEGTLSQEVYALWFGPYANLSTARGEATKAANGNWRHTKVLSSPILEDSNGYVESTHFIEAFVIKAAGWERE